VQLFERQLIKDAIKRHQGDMRKVMAELGLPRRTLNEKMAKYNLERSRSLAE
jgi:DNA-binding NtrC family response regulator